MLFKKGSLPSARAMSSEERIAAMSHGVINPDILGVEIEHRTGISQRKADLVLRYAKKHQKEFPGYPLVNLDDIANIIGGMKQAPEKAARGIEKIDTETARRILECEDTILWECRLQELCS